MGLEEVVGDILAAARARADAVVKDADAERDKLLEQSRDKARILKEERLREAQRGAAQLRVRELAAAELEVKRARLAMERDILEAAASGARERVAAMSPAEDEALLGRLLRDGAVPGYRIYSARRNEPFMRRASPLYAGVTDCLGGLVFESPDGSVRIDSTYDTVLRQAVERTMRDIYGVLFPR
jgi:V/A-type H+-transporting ATPase subunit E